MTILAPWPEYTGWLAHEAKYHEARADAAIARLKVATDALNMLAAQDSGKPGSTARADCMAIMAKTALAQIGEIPVECGK